ncbi:MAG: hypothetical protein J2P47_15380, partial [Acetobacteraceae bacterium]|nr:hypothetical protein [Acetobacteraceae bacterium]
MDHAARTVSRYGPICGRGVRASAKLPQLPHRNNGNDALLRNFRTRAQFRQLILRNATATMAVGRTS